MLVSIIFALLIAMYGLPFVHYTILKFRRCLRPNSRKLLKESTEPIEIRLCNKTLNSKLADKNIFSDKHPKLVRVYSLYFNVWVWIWILYLAITADLEEYEERYHDVRLVGNILGYIHVPSFALYLYAETFFCWEWDLLGKIEEEKTCRTYTNALTEARPVVTVNVSAWHSETSYHIGSYRLDGRTHNYIMPCQSKVVDYEESREFSVTRWGDITPSLDSLSLEPSKLTKLVLTKTVYLGDEETRTKFTELVSELDSSVRRMSPESEVETILNEDVAGFNDKFLAYLENQRPKWWLKRWVLLVASFLLCTWIYRIVFSASTQKARVRIQKSIYVP